jgi:cytochrome P450
LIKNPPIYQDLMAELDDAAARGKLSSPVQYSEALALPLLCACIKEAMRLHPSVGLTMPRVVPQGGLVLCDRLIPAGCRVGMNAAVVHFDQAIFGPDADEFRPSRWILGDSTAMNKYMLHFGAGTRTCIGKNVGLRIPPSTRFFII